MALDNLVTIGGIIFTDEGRTFSEQRDERSIPIELASGKIVKYVKADKRSFSIAWQYLPQNATFTLDNNGARDELRPICYTGSTTSIIVQNGINFSEYYVVFVEDYSEEIILRDATTGNILYNISISMREQ